MIEKWFGNEGRICFELNKRKGSKCFTGKMKEK